MNAINQQLYTVRIFGLNVLFEDLVKMVCIYVTGIKGRFSCSAYFPRFAVHAFSVKFSHKTMTLLWH